MNILIANRGEIARRIARTCRDLGAVPIMVTTPLDASSVHASQAERVVTIDSYLDSDAIVAAARSHGAAVHPGYGFLAENAEFAQAVIDAGLTWIGPRPDVIDQMGSKINARAIAENAGVALIPGYAESQNDADLRAGAESIGWPVLVKASAGGGGKGIRIARGSADFEQALSEARTEADRLFGDESVIVERYVERPRHIEVQIIGDKHANVRHLGTRECSVQRRYQKLFEEAPAPNLADTIREGLHHAALKLAEAVGYDSAGTVEFIVDDESGDFFFLEMNTRLQVEHPVTECITGVDLVRLMIESATGTPLGFTQDQVTFTGCALEARITAEDPWNDFAPQIGMIHQLGLPDTDSTRWDSAIQAGSQVTPHFDSMIAKLIVAGADRDRALQSMRDALDQLIIGGLVTTAGFHRWLIDQPPVVQGRVTTRFLDETELPEPPEPAVAAAARLWSNARAGEPTSVWQSVPGFSLTPTESVGIVGLRSLDATLHEVPVISGTASAATTPTISAPTITSPMAASPGRAIVDTERGQVAINVGGHTHFFTVVDRTELWAPSAQSRAGTGDALVAPFPAVVTEVNVASGDNVLGGQVLVVIEAMKMLHSLKSNGAALVDEVGVGVGDQVATDQILITFETPSGEDSP